MSIDNTDCVYNVFMDIKEPVEPFKIVTEEVGTTKDGYTIYRSTNGAGGYTYRTDELSAMYFDTCLHNMETMEQILGIERTLC